MHCGTEAIFADLGGEGVHVMEPAVIRVCGNAVDVVHRGQLPGREDEQLTHLAELMTAEFGIPALTDGLFLQMNKREGLFDTILDELLLAFGDARCDQNSAIFSGLNP